MLEFCSRRRDIGMKQDMVLNKRLNIDNYEMYLDDNIRTQEGNGRPMVMVGNDYRWNSEHKHLLMGWLELIEKMFVIEYVSNPINSMRAKTTSS